MPSFQCSASAARATMSAISDGSKGALKQAKTRLRRASITWSGVAFGARRTIRTPGRRERTSSRIAASSSRSVSGAVIRTPKARRRSWRRASTSLARHLDRVAFEQRRGPQAPSAGPRRGRSSVCAPSATSLEKESILAPAMPGRRKGGTREEARLRGRSGGAGRPVAVPRGPPGARARARAGRPRAAGPREDGREALDHRLRRDRRDERDDRAGGRAGARGDRGGRQLLRRGPELRQRRGHARPRARAPPQGRVPRLQDPGADAGGGDAGARELAAEDAHRPLRPLPAPRGHEPEGRGDDPRPGRRHGGLRGGEEGGQGPLPRLLGALRRGGDRAPGRLRVRHDPLPGQLRHLARRQLRPAGAREGEGQGHGDPLPEGDGEGPVAGRRGEALRQVLVRAARHARGRPRWACASRCPTR